MVLDLGLWLGMQPPVASRRVPTVSDRRQPFLPHRAGIIDRSPSVPPGAGVRRALQVAWLIAQHDNASVARAWFQGLNPQLDDRSAARLLREGELDEVGPQILSAARAFVSGG